MKIGDFPLVEALVGCRNHLIGLRDEGRIEISINGQYQARDFVDEVAPAIRLELGRRIEDLDSRLRGLGVNIEPFQDEAATRSISRR